MPQLSQSRVLQNDPGRCNTADVGSNPGCGIRWLENPGHAIWQTTFAYKCVYVEKCSKKKLTGDVKVSRVYSDVQTGLTYRIYSGQSF